jgi:diguanylate cyclase (GGDEF)-like protein
MFNNIYIEMVCHSSGREDFVSVTTDKTSQALQDAPHSIAELEAQIVALKAENQALSLALAEVERVSSLDTLTPVHNRRHFLGALHQRLARMRRYGDVVALIFIDVNNLKTVNDLHGHGAGDAVLMCIATRLKAQLRETDVVARIGGDEFGLILDQINADELDTKVEFLRQSITAEPVRYGDIDIAPSAAFGCTVLAQDDDELTALSRADAAMYKDKALNSV